MRTVRINKGELVSALAENRKRHKEDYTKASEGYRVDMLAQLHNFAVRLEKGENVQVFVRENPPHDHTEDYDVALKMLSMSVDHVVELTEGEFRHMVLDDWDWQQNWKIANSKYLGK